jgi:hypothetical protein
MSAVPGTRPHQGVLRLQGDDGSNPAPLCSLRPAFRWHSQGVRGKAAEPAAGWCERGKLTRDTALGFVSRPEALRALRRRRHTDAWGEKAGDARPRAPHGGSGPGQSR